MNLRFPGPRDVQHAGWPGLSEALRGTSGAYLLAALLGVTVLLQAMALGEISPVSVALPMALAGFAARERISDGLAFAAAHLAASWLDVAIGPATLAVLVLSVLALTGRPRLSLALGIGLACAVAGGAYLMERYASTSLTSQDLRYFAQQFAANREIFATQPSVGTALLGGVAAFALVAALACLLDGQPAKERRVLARLALCAFLAVCMASAVFLPAAKAGQEPAPNLHGQRPYTPLLTFLSTLFSEPSARWTRVPTEAFAAAVDKRVEQATTAAAPADIVLFLQESQFNPALIEGCPSGLCELPTFSASSNTTDFGPLRVPVHGSGTWLSEFAAMTGLPHHLWGRAGRYAPFNIAPGVRQSLVRSLKAAGYHTIGIYPTQGGLMNGREAFRGYGFDEFVDAQGLGLTPGFASPDWVLHAAAIDALERGRHLGKPVFVFALTIFNHSEHGIHLERVPQEVQQPILAAFPDPDEAMSLADYVWRSREFSQSFEAMSHTLLGGARPTVLAWFGDHQPPFALAPGLPKRIASIIPGAGPFTTWYGVRSNVSPVPAPPAAQAALDLVFLPGVLAERAGVPLDRWLAANVLARNECRGSLSDCAPPSAGSAYVTYLLDTLGAVAP
jgi:hypothetical protein